MRTDRGKPNDRAESDDALQQAPEEAVKGGWGYLSSP
jgi:hypothetical protein